MNDLFGFEELFPLQWSSLMCVCVYRPELDTSPSCLSYGGMSAGGRAVHTPLLLHLFCSLSSFSGDHICFFCHLFFPSLALIFRPLKVSESAETWGSKEVKGSAPSSHRGPPLSLFTGPPAKSHLYPFLYFWGINLLWQAGLWWAC